MKVYGLLIDGAKCQPGGHEHDIEWARSGLSTARDLKERKKELPYKKGL